MNKPNWKTSSYTGGSGGNCIEVADHDNAVAVRDTKDRTGPVIRFTPDAWRALVKQVKQSLAQDSEKRACPDRKSGQALWLACYR
jgi:hypothetical protein